MINRISYLVTGNTTPYENLALEELLLHRVEPGECILYLWRNRRTVVIGRNQNCRSECRIPELERDGGHLARRLSGGGAVFHDLGNLNFTFLVHSNDYDLDRQLAVILGAVRALGIVAEKSGRNDLTADGRKFSGNAFYRSGNRQYHHGTIMVDADLEQLSRYLTVPADKLAAKGVASVRSRVVNLRELNPTITVEQMQTALVAAFGAEYALPPQVVEAGRVDSGELSRRTQRFASYDWRIGREPDCTTTLSRRFGWGGIELRLSVSAGKVAAVTAYTDAMDAELAPLLTQRLEGVTLSPDSIKKALAPTPEQDSALNAVLGDVAIVLEEWQNGAL